MLDGGLSKHEQNNSAAHSSGILQLDKGHSAVFQSGICHLIIFFGVVFFLSVFQPTTKCLFNVDPEQFFPPLVFVLLCSCTRQCRKGKLNFCKISSHLVGIMADALYTIQEKYQFYKCHFYFVRNCNENSSLVFQVILN